MVYWLGRVLGANPSEDPSEEREVTLSASDRHPFPFKDPTLSASETILVVDDERFVRDFCASVLTQSGYEVLLGENVGGHQKTSFFWTSAGSALAAWQSLGRMQSGVVPSRRWDRILARVGKSGYPTRREGWGMHTGRAPGESVGRTMVGRAGKQSGTVQSPAHVVLGVGMAARKAGAAVT